MSNSLSTASCPASLVEIVVVARFVKRASVAKKSGVVRCTVGSRARARSRSDCAKALPDRLQFAQTSGRRLRKELIRVLIHDIVPRRGHPLQHRYRKHRSHAPHRSSTCCCCPVSTIRSFPRSIVASSSSAQVLQREQHGLPARSLFAPVPRVEGLPLRRGHPAPLASPCTVTPEAGALAASAIRSRTRASRSRASRASSATIASGGAARRAAEGARQLARAHQRVRVRGA